MEPTKFIIFIVLVVGVCVAIYRGFLAGFLKKRKIGELK
jgi:uncharacterized membrane protein required for colicin V production